RYPPPSPASSSSDPPFSHLLLRSTSSPSHLLFVFSSDSSSLLLLVFFAAAEQIREKSDLTTDGGLGQWWRDDDFCVVSVEGLTAVYAIAGGESYSYILQFTISLGQLYGTAVCFITSLLEGNNFAATPFYYYAYYIGANAS
ncbi:Probable 3-beta-hydroxysteroid-Delta(8),Delta(7)-isomerase, partial [Linum perenne]